MIALTTARPAATIMVLRDGDGGVELLMLRRSQKASFFPHAWVFPGGRVDPADAHVSVRGDIDDLPADGQPFAVAAIRECFEESGVWLGDGDASPALRRALNAREATLADAGALVADLERLEMWSWWITPTIEPKRYDTRFFITALRPDELAASDHARHDEVETVDSAWIRPADALAASDFFLAPPTYMTLRELAGYATAADAMAAAAAREVRPIMPVHGEDRQGRLVIALPGDPMHSDPHPASFARRVVLHNHRWIIDPE
ncbi:MAG: 8-oxo-dGTP pyrophosphatase MutT (NUDIX family) [Myxococcota bacterium]